MKTTKTLPENYQEIFSVDLSGNRKLALLVNLLALAIGAVMALAMHLVIPFGSIFSQGRGFSGYGVKMLVLIAAMLVYMVLHELVHGIAMKLYGCSKVRYGFTGLYAFAASDDYFAKKPYIVIALAPIVVWGIVLAVINFLVPLDWFWVVYILQIVNISGAAGDLYVTLKFIRLPADILVQDSGVSMRVYSAEQAD